MVAAAVLNAATTRTKILTIIEAHDSERDLIWFNNSITPERMRVLLMPVYAKMRETGLLKTPEGKSESKLEQLSKFGVLRDSGVLTGTDGAGV